MANGKILGFRKKYNLSREDLASKLGVSWTTIYRWEKGLVKPHKVLREKLNKIMQGYGEIRTIPV